MTDATAAPVEEAPATPATPQGDTTADAGAATTSATDAAKERSAEAGQTGSTETEDVPELTALTKEQRKTLGEQLKKLDPEARKVYNQLLDGKLQETATERKAREAAEAKANDLSKVADIIGKIESDPEGAIATLKALYPSKAKGGKIEVPDEFLKSVESTLDDASKPLAKVIAPAVMAVLGDKLKDIEAFVQSQRDNAAQAQAQADMQAFDKANPDWKEFEPAMLEWAKKIPRGEQSNGEYLGALYALASHGAKLKAAQKTSAEKILEKVARAAGNAEPDTTSVSGARVARKPPASTAEAWAQAQEELARGEIAD